MCGSIFRYPIGAQVSERRACQVLAQPRSTQRRPLCLSDEERRLTDRITQLASLYGRYGYRRITALLRHEGWQVNHKRVERIWRREGLKVPRRQPKIVTLDQSGEREWYQSSSILMGESRSKIICSSRCSDKALQPQCACCDDGGRAAHTAGNVRLRARPAPRHGLDRLAARPSRDG